MPLTLGGRNLSEWLRRAGFNNPQQPLPSNDYVQPVELVSDVSRLSTVLSPSQASAGALISLAIVDMDFELHSLAPGGCFVTRIFLTSSNVADHFAWALFDSPGGALYGSIVSTIFNHFPDRPVKSILRYGERTGSDRIGNEAMGYFRTTANVPQIHVFDPPLHIAPGRVLYLENPVSTINGAVAFFVDWWESPVPKPT